MKQHDLRACLRSQQSLLARVCGGKIDVLARACGAVSACLRSHDFFANQLCCKGKWPKPTRLKYYCEIETSNNTTLARRVFASRRFFKGQYVTEGA